MVEIKSEGNRKFYRDFYNKEINITDEKGNNLYATDDFIDISYASRKSEASVLSNLFPYDFNFRGFEVASVEGVLQGLKHKDIITQQKVFKYAGKDAYHIRVASFLNDWRKTGLLYFNAREINRFSIEYQQLLNEIYLSVLSNPLFCACLLYTANRELLHSDGKVDPNETILTTREYILRLEYIRASLLKGENIINIKKQLDKLPVVIAEEQAHMKILV